MSELAGSWTYRSFNPTFVTGNLTPEEDALILGEAVLTFRTSAPAQAGNLEGTYEWGDGGLNLNGTFLSGAEISNIARFDIVGTGRPGTGTNGWEYRYQGHLSWPWWMGGESATELPTLVGSVIRAKPHGERKAGEVFSFIAVKQQYSAGPGAWSSPWISLAGSWAYRSFYNNPAYPYLTAPPTARGLVLQEAVLRLETPTERQGTIELPGGVLDVNIIRVRSAEVPPEFSFRAIGSAGEYHFHGHLTRNWPNEASSSGVVDQRPALVGTVATLTGYLDADRRLGPVYSVYPFIAVKQ
jgi:hypothetical protein